MYAPLQELASTCVFFASACEMKLIATTRVLPMDFGLVGLFIGLSAGLSGVAEPYVTLNNPVWVCLAHFLCTLRTWVFSNPRINVWSHQVRRKLEQREL